MRWRDVLMGAVVTLVVTVMGGVIIYYATRAREAPPTPPAAEKLVYDVDRPVDFKSDQTALSFINLRVKNVGDKSATNVAAGVKFDDKTKITDKQVSLSSGPVGKFDVALVGQNKLNVGINVLTPGETATITILTDTVDKVAPEIGVKSDGSTGENLPFLSTIEFPKRSGWQFRDLTGVLVPLAMIAQICILFVMRTPLQRLLRRHLPSSRSVNNTAFVLLHSGLIDRAADLLSGAVSNSGANPHILANYGLALGLKGDVEQSLKILDAAEFWADNNTDERAIISFSRSLLAFAQNQESEAVTLMRNALTLSKHEVARYAGYSKIVASQRERSPELHSLLNEFGIPKATLVAK